MVMPEAQELRHDTLGHTAASCSAALTEAARFVTGAIFDAPLRPPLARACELLDDIDEILIKLDPVRDHAAFERAAALHRRLETIQSQVPRQYRRLLAR